MGKYSANIDINEDTSHSKILRGVKPNTTVLEFGPAKGYMTQYMKDVLGCQVYVVEIDEDDYQEAMQFAVDGFCGDAGNFAWFERFKGIQFDYILFADVLEHLYSPKDILKQATQLLKADGRVLVSVPNIAHSSIIINLIQNKFEYQKVGLLDDTHIRFFTYDNLNAMLNAAGLTSLTEDAIYVAPSKMDFWTFFSDYSDLDGDSSIIKSKAYENVFQFIFEAVKTEFFYDEHLQTMNNIVANMSTAPAEAAFATIFFDTGKGFNEEEKAVFDFTGNRFLYATELPEYVCRVRFDPIEGKGVILRNVEMTSNTGVVTGFGRLTVLPSADPQMLIDIAQDTRFIQITGEMVGFDVENLALLAEIKDMVNKKTELESHMLPQRMAEIEALKHELTAQEKNLKSLETELLEKEKSLETLVSGHKLKELAYREELSVANATIESERRERVTLAGFNQELREESEKRVKITAEYLAEIEQLQTKYDDAVATTLNLHAQNQHHLNLYHAIRLSTFWKMTKPARAGIDLTKRILRNTPIVKHAYRTLWSVRQFGLRATLQGQVLSPTEIILTDTLETTETSQTRAPIAPSNFQKNTDFTNYNFPVKAIAMYLPQFHRIAENDEWWGNGFTEWTNTRKAQPVFEGHYQPRVPHSDFGYYSLDNAETLKKQALLAKQHGIHGFCFYHYWFSGKRLLETPLDILLDTPEIDLNFCVCWANENWTRRWDGQDNEVLIKQEYSAEDPRNFIVDLKKYLDDKRYIRIDGKPVIIIYNIAAIPDIVAVLSQWRETAREIGIGEILIWAVDDYVGDKAVTDSLDDIDASLAFPPRNLSELDPRPVYLEEQQSHLFDYDTVVSALQRKIKQQQVMPTNKPHYLMSMLNWDNSARKKLSFNAWTNFSFKKFYDWNKDIVDYTVKLFNESERFVFVNAWNEWAEGTYLEPDKKYGYTAINTLSRAMLDLPIQHNILDTGSNWPTFTTKSQKRFTVAIQIHLFYPDLAEEVLEHLDAIPFEYDCYITTNNVANKMLISEMFNKKCSANQVIIEVVENVGRDVAPFINQMKKHYHDYDYIGHIHTKKSKHADHGDSWRKYLYHHLLGDATNLNKLFEIFECDSSVGLIFPKTYGPLESFLEWGSNKNIYKTFVDYMGFNVEIPEEHPFFIAGNMFWARTDAIKDIFYHEIPSSFWGEEAGQVDATLAHAIERLWVYLAESNGYSYIMTKR